MKNLFGKQKEVVQTKSEEEIAIEGIQLMTFKPDDDLKYTVMGLVIGDPLDIMVDPNYIENELKRAAYIKYGTEAKAVCGITYIPFASKCRAVGTVISY
ncbi:hypothetical protein [Bacillus sp. UNCCL81]|uniref:hypothetical protein n=1 Tax=Bacillus sp. UNCCL81 TaxID=1502755 RepID=UPI0008F387BE|nr:hypothetical protein [Bacillus sp. UNCCL81]SFD48460.1 hypothetical protein SAMN02799633_03927 [Bacillus sp. UNCCL81]